MSNGINILGETPKEQWLNAIGIMELCIGSNARNVLDTMDGLCDRAPMHDCDECDECGRCRSLEVVVEQTKVFADEMRRLVEGAFGDKPETF